MLNQWEIHVEDSCKAHSKSIGKMENSTPCKIVTPENFTLKLGIRAVSYTHLTLPTIYSV